MTRWPQRSGPKWSGTALRLLPVATVLVLAGCGTSTRTATPTTLRPASGTVAQSSSSTSPGPTTLGTDVTASTGPPVTGGQGPAVATTVLPAGPALCTTSQLTAGLGGEDGTAGTIYYQLTLRNSSSTACYVSGYPGVSFVAGTDGHQVGAAANRVAGPTPTVVLGPAQAAASTLGIVDSGAYPSACQQTAVLGLRVYPPNRTAALFVAHTDKGCANPTYVTLRIQPLRMAA
jgi:hypothetical protein